MIQSSKLTGVRILLVIFIHFLLFLFTAYYVFVANDKSLQISAILELNYLLPVLVYAGGVTVMSIAFFILLQKFIYYTFSLLISPILALPTGILLVATLFNLVS